MPIEPLSLNNQDNKINAPSQISAIEAIKERIKEAKEEEDDKKPEKESNRNSEVKDVVSLSNAALNAISNTQQAGTPSEQRIEDKIADSQSRQNSIINNIESEIATDRILASKESRDAVEFRELEAVSRTRELSPLEVDRQNEILNSFNNNSAGEESVEIKAVSVTDIIAKAVSSLETIEAEVSEINREIESGTATGGDFERAKEINEFLNAASSSGAGSREISSEDRQKLDELNERFSNVVREAEDRQLSEEEVDELSQLQREINTVKGFEINVLDSIGRNGVVV